MRVEVVCCAAPHAFERVELELADGATLADALRESGLAARLPAPPDAGVWGRVLPADTPLRDGDRVELYRALTVDPKEARRLRYRRDRAR